MGCRAEIEEREDEEANSEAYVVASVTESNDSRPTKRESPKAKAKAKAEAEAKAKAKAKAKANGEGKKVRGFSEVLLLDHTEVPPRRPKRTSAEQESTSKRQKSAN